MTAQALYAHLPSVDLILNHELQQPLIHQFGKEHITTLVRQLLDQARETIRDQQQLPQWLTLNECDGLALSQQKLARINLFSHHLAQSTQPLQHQGQRRVFNLTGTILHTNLGRSLQAEAAIKAVTEVMRFPSTLEYSLQQGKRGHRDQAISEQLQQLIGCEDACLVNNNAAAVLLMLASLASGKEAIVSRGELVEIGGSFRIPDVMRQAGCQLVEVGATNRTHLKDYQQAINENTALLMKVHTSNYMIQGFTSAVSEAELCALGRAMQVPVISDLGSGSLIDLAQYGLPSEPMPQKMLQDGIDLVSFSGDKLLGGPQAGIIAGKSEFIEQLQHHPLKRALRCDKMTLAALEATLNLYRHPERLPCDLPTLSMLTRSLDTLTDLGERLVPYCQQLVGQYFTVTVMPSMGQIGSGALPTEQLESVALCFSVNNNQTSYTLNDLADLLASGEIPIIGRIHHDKLWLCLRGISHEQDFIAQLAQLSLSNANHE
ncbi:L-seryl-tRNA(Sec) selenium transferase [Photobacterium sp. GB-27]|uniref:L-seryl-tRNA(Sec) selenium transferase n=1 Tax=Photobacterium sp. GB-27 TaxID=2022109 RepID=UPI000D151E13|nr:L-seryl-tRNA(Sec) selenium transferase [Photobacterium sp. GB-27]PSV37805.1 L-seryl-tRNA(Sec) selenium transferase [Photobacterium sp. GB-27]